MAKTETLEELYQQKFNWLPANLQRALPMFAIGGKPAYVLRFSLGLNFARIGLKTAIHAHGLPATFVASKQLKVWKRKKYGLLPEPRRAWVSGSGCLQPGV